MRSRCCAPSGCRRGRWRLSRSWSNESGQYAKLANRVIAILTQRLGIPPETVTQTAELAEDLGVDSVDAGEFPLALEREFNITLPDAALVDVKTVQDVVDQVRDRVAAPREVARD